ncbi:MAG: 50S ribosomal protein L25, partial [Candidatus Aminicenantales bacterium]
MSIVVKTEKRQGLGTNAARRLRAQGFVPAVLYGESMETQPLVLSKKDIVQILRLESGENTIFKVAVDADAYDAMIKAMQIDPSTDELLHVDLIRIAMDKPIRVTVPIVHHGEPFGVKTEGGFI